jgi:DHA2 family multidrug resistance protein
MIRGVAQSLMAHGTSAADAQPQAYGVVQNIIQQQATMLAYIDNFYILATIILAMVPLVFLMRKTKSSGEMAVH